MSIRVVIVEDEMLLAEDIATDLHGFGYEVAGIFISGEQCQEEIGDLKPDVVVMDIRIKGSLDGIETARRINEILPTPIVYLTSNSDQATIKRLLDVFPSAFISKPYQKTDLMMAIEMAVRKGASSTETEKCIFIKASSGYRKIELADILFLEAEGSYTRIQTTAESHLVSYNLRYFEESINSGQFRRIHRSFIVNTQHVQTASSSQISIGDKNIPVSKTYAKEVLEWFGTK